MMMIRAAKIDDIQQIQIVRNSVKENTLSNPNLVTDKDCEEFISVRGKGWVCEIDQHIVGFAIADLKENNISNNKKWLPSFYHFLSGFLKKIEFFTTLYQVLFTRLF